MARGHIPCNLLCDCLEGGGRTQALAADAAVRLHFKELSKRQYIPFRLRSQLAGGGKHQRLHPARRSSILWRRPGRRAEQRAHMSISGPFLRCKDIEFLMAAVKLQIYWHQISRMCIVSTSPTVLIQATPPLLGRRDDPRLNPTLPSCLCVKASSG